MSADPELAPAEEESSLVRSVIGLVKTKGLKYSLVSVVNVLFGGGLLLFFQSHMNPIEANLASVVISSVPAYYMNRAWVWGKRGKSHWKREVLPFWGFVFAGLVLSTGAIAFVNDHTLNKVIILFTQLTAFGILWVLRFFFFDKLFHLEQDAPENDPEDVPFEHHLHLPFGHDEE